MKETLSALNTQAYLPQLAHALGVLAEECYRMNPNHLRDVTEVLLPQEQRRFRKHWSPHCPTQRKTASRRWT